MRKGLLVGLASAAISSAVMASAASAAPKFFDKEGGVLLRSVSSLPSKDQPAAIEFGTVEAASYVLNFSAAESLTIVCHEVEYGTTVLTNTLEGVEGENKLALPFAVAEGDECMGGAAGGLIPTYFDTTAAGALPATITFSGVLPAITAKLHKLKISFEITPGVFCTATFEGTPGEVVDVKGPFAEESMPNTFIHFSKAPFSGTCATKPIKKFTGELTTLMFVETPSTATDTVWIE
jgi:hypothetical protein